MIRKAVILTAGLGTRFLPITKVIPKAMLPIGAKPIIQYLVEEAIQSGIEEIIIVISPEQTVIQEYFLPNTELEQKLATKNKQEALKEVKSIGRGAKFSFIIQQEPLGDGHALLQAKHLLADENFAVLFGDDIIQSEIPALKQLISLHEETGTSILCVEKIQPEKSGSYGIVDPKTQTNNKIEIKALIEKPTPENAPSNLGIIGKYICTNEVLRHIEQGKPNHQDSELRLIDGFIHMLQNNLPLHALKIEGTRFDTGNPNGLIKANLALSQSDPNLKN